MMTIADAVRTMTKRMMALITLRKASPSVKLLPLPTFPADAKATGPVMSSHEHRHGTKFAAG
jgi:hypothetical protein